LLHCSLKLSRKAIGTYSTHYTIRLESKTDGKPGCTLFFKKSVIRSVQISIFSQFLDMFLEIFSLCN
jgi:hypothetical protein